MNYGLALLRAGNTQAGIAELLKAQKLDPKLPHTWFNLGIAYKKQGDLDAALAQFRGHGPPRARRAGHPLPDGHDPQGAGRSAQAAMKEFETARDLNPLLAAPHFQLYGLYRQAQPPRRTPRQSCAFSRN